jgi:hypothetical protein
MLFFLFSICLLEQNIDSVYLSTVFWLQLVLQNSAVFGTKKWGQKKNKIEGTETSHRLCVSDFCPPTFCHVLALVLVHIYD